MTGLFGKKKEISAAEEARTAEIKEMNGLLLEDQPAYKEDAASYSDDYRSQRRLMRALMNVRYPKVIPVALQKKQDQILSEERQSKGIVRSADIPASPKDPRLAVWQGDITRLGVDAIANAANSQMLGCFVPNHGCIDNAIHSAAGLQLRQECYEYMKHQMNVHGSDYQEPTGSAMMTDGYNLPAKHVIHTVGPIVQFEVTDKLRADLASCYKSCLRLADGAGLESIAFCCISTGVFHFPHREAAEIAVRTVVEYLDENPDCSVKKVIFNVFNDRDLAIYEALLG